MTRATASAPRLARQISFASFSEARHTGKAHATLYDALVSYTNRANFFDAKPKAEIMPTKNSRNDANAKTCVKMGDSRPSSGLSVVIDALTPHWTEEGTQEYFEKRVGALPEGFNGPGWYETPGGDTLYVVRIESLTSKKHGASRTKKPLYTFHCWNEHGVRARMQAALEAFLKEIS